MKLETFFEKFDQLADAPDAVAKMRELVRRLAVTGVLVPQDTNDEPAENLIARVASALPDKKSENPFIEEIEASITVESEFELPIGWAWMPLGRVGIWATGCGFPMQYQGKTDGEILFCKVSDMNLPGNQIEIHTTIHSIDADVMKKIRARANRVGTVVFPKIGGAIATHKRRLVVKPTVIDNNCSGIQSIGLTDCRWLLLLMRTLDLTKYQSGTSVPAVSQSSLDPIRIGLPPLAEQARIVAKVDELMGLCDRLGLQQQERETRHAALARASLARFADAPTSDNLSFLFHPSYTISPADLRKSILTLAVLGKLVTQDPNDEPAEESLQATRSLFERLVAAKKLSSPKPLPPIDENDVPFSLPTGWAWCRLGEIVRISSGNGLIAKDMKEGPIPVYGGNGVNGHHDAHNVSKRTLVIGRVGFYCGSIHVTPERAWVTDNAFITTFDEEHVDLEFLSWPLKATDLRERDSATAQPVISGSKVYPTLLALPPSPNNTASWPKWTN